MTPERIAELREQADAPWGAAPVASDRGAHEWHEMLDEIERLHGMYADACTEIEVHLADNQKLRALASEILEAYEEDTPWLSAMERAAAEFRERLTQ